MLQFEANTVVYPPNKGFQRRIEFSTHPVVYNSLLFIDFNDKGEAIVGSSSLDKTLWESTLLFCNDEESLLQLNFQKGYIGATASDGKFLNENTIVLAEDTGTLNVITVNEKQLFCNSYYRALDRIPKLAVWKNTSKVLTCSGNNLTIWDINNRGKEPANHYENFHTELVTYVDTLRREQHIFVSASMDRKCVIWDDRLSSPASVLYQNEFSALTSVAFNQNNTNYIVVGTEAGDIYLIDKREPLEFISVANCNCDIFRFTFDGTNKFAVCGNSNKVLVFNCEDEILNNAYCNDKHSGIVRGLAWYNENLYSCDFNKQIVKHLL